MESACCASLPEDFGSGLLDQELVSLRIKSLPVCPLDGAKLGGALVFCPAATLALNCPAPVWREAPGDQRMEEATPVLDPFDTESAFDLIEDLLSQLQREVMHQFNCLSLVIGVQALRRHQS